MKTCVTCKQEKPLAEFNRNLKTKDGRQSSCRSCSNQYDRDRLRDPQRAQANRDRVTAHYQAHKEERQTYVLRYQMLRKIRAVNYLGGKCPCGEEHPSALQFHHRDPSTKLFNITTKHLGSPKLYPWDTVIAPELDKCDLLCANCHFKEHAVLPWEVIEELKRQAEEEV